VIGWIALRLLTSVLAAYASFWLPITEFEVSVPIWPPSMPWSRWLRRLLLAPWNRWDVEYYRHIALIGYSRGNGTLQFHPLYPWLAAPLARWIDQALFPLLLVSSLAGLLCWMALIQLGQLDFAKDDVWFGSLMWACFPAAFILFAPYSEALFSLWAVLCLLQTRQRRWWLAGGLGALAVLTRRQGLLLFLPLVWELGQSKGWNWEENGEQFWDWLSPLLIPLAFGLWIGYRSLGMVHFPPELGLHFSSTLKSHAAT
jgi:Gpi18-like mannosyltransferase